ncbi:MAG: hypothetical protein HZA17_11840 [Nitrospirae bacterium]|nr:hypothetical protein [Nitrospirota bacterium]
MEITVTLTEKELKFLQRMAEELGNFRKRQESIEGAVHECINMAMFDEAEESV